MFTVSCLEDCKRQERPVDWTYSVPGFFAPEEFSTNYTPVITRPECNPFLPSAPHRKPSSKPKSSRGRHRPWLSRTEFEPIRRSRNVQRAFEEEQRKAKAAEAASRRATASLSASDLPETDTSAAAHALLMLHGDTTINGPDVGMIGNEDCLRKHNDPAARRRKNKARDRRRMAAFNAKKQAEADAAAAAAARHDVEKVAVDVKTEK